MMLEDISYEVRGAIFEVYNELGPGLLESTYEGALVCELNQRGLKVERQVTIPAVYKGEILDSIYRIDLLVERQVIIELKSVEMLMDVHKKQILTYLKLADKRVGILVNFNVAKLENRVSIIRIVN